MEELKNRWNKGLARVKKAEQFAKNSPNEFGKYEKNFLELCGEMSWIMNEYERLMGDKMPDEIFTNGFK
jgi:hypothetical protein